MTTEEKATTILVVDDNADIILLTRRILERYNYTILTANDGRTALEVVRQDHPDLILLDVMLPEMDGLQVCRHIKADPDTQKLMVILVTGRGSTTNLVEGLEAGADDYITKPFQLAELTARVRSALRIKELADEIDERNVELLQSQRDRMKAEKMATIGVLATGVAHEFNNIMSGIAGFAELARRNSDYKDQLVDVVKVQCERAIQITNSLSTFYKPQVEACRTDVVSEIENALCLVSNAIKDKKIQLRRELRDVSPVLAQPGQLQEVFLNLILNSCQAVDGHGVVSIHTEPERDRILITIRDDGCGIAQEHLPRVFDPFFTTKGTLGGGTESGSGLGLSVCYNIVNSFGGNLSVRSEVGKGTSFTVDLPPAPPVPASQGQDPNVAQTDGAPSRREQTTNILVGDSDHCVREMVEDYLRDCDVSSCTTWSEVQNNLEQNQFDLAIIDSALKGGDEFVRQFEETRQKQPRMAVVLTSADLSSARSLSAIKNADRHLLKPYSLDNLANILDSIRANDTAAAVVGTK